jgi:type II restriction enzyme
LGSPSTLLNAGKTTNFIFKMSASIDEIEIERINFMMVKRGKKESADLKGRVKSIYSNNKELIFFKA